MKKRGNKRAITNIEMSIAMILFVVSVFSIILIFNLYHKPDKINFSVLDDFENNFLNYADNFTKVGVYIDSGAGSGICVNISLNKNVNNQYVFFDNAQINSDLKDNYLTFESQADNYYEIYDFLSNNLNYAGTCSESTYNYTIPVQGKIFLGDKLNQITSEFENTNIKIIDKSGVELVNTNKTSPKGAEVLAKTFFILVYDNISDPNNPKIKNCQVNVKIWK